jgi:hypothetical protein
MNPKPVYSLSIHARIFYVIFVRNLFKPFLVCIKFLGYKRTVKALDATRLPVNVGLGINFLARNIDSTVYDMCLHRVLLP